MLETAVLMTVYYMVYLTVNTPCFILMLTHHALFLRQYIMLAKLFLSIHDCWLDQQAKSVI
jgi:hypothetical protein